MGISDPILVREQYGWILFLIKDCFQFWIIFNWKTRSYVPKSTYTYLTKCLLSNYNCFQQFEVRFLFEGNNSAPPPFFFPFKRFSLKFLVAKINNLIKTFYGLHINCNSAKIIARCFHYYYFYYKLFIFTIIIYFNYIIRIKAAEKKHTRRKYISTEEFGDNLGSI